MFPEFALSGKSYSRVLITNHASNLKKNTALSAVFYQMEKILKNYNGIVRGINETLIPPCISPVPKRFTTLFLHFILSFTISLLLILLSIYFNRFYGSYQWAECLHSILAGLSLAKFISNSLELCWEWSPGCLETFYTLWCSFSYFYIIY